MSGLYSNARELFLTAAMSWASGTYGVILASNAYVPNLTTDQYVTNIPAPAILARANLASLSSSAGAAHAANVTFASVAGASIQYLVIYQNTGVDSTSPLVCMIDAASGLPAFPSGTPITLDWDTTNGIFVL